MKTSHGTLQVATKGVAAVDDKHQIVVAAEAYGQGPENNLLRYGWHKDSFLSLWFNLVLLQDGLIGLQHFQRANHLVQILLQNMGINFGCFYISMPEQLLYYSNIRA